MVYWPAFLRELDATERAWNTRTIHYPRADAVPFLPYPIPQFIPLLAEAVMSAPVRDAMPVRFLDVGAGTGTKMRLAEAMFDLEAHGIEIVPAFVAEGRAHNLRMRLISAFDYDGYGTFDIVYVNRPSTSMDELEGLVMGKMAPDSVLILVNGRCDPGKDGWITVSQEFGEPTVGVWIKPWKPQQP